MKIKCEYRVYKDRAELYPVVYVLESRKDDPTILQGSNRFGYYILGSLNWWFRPVSYLNDALDELQQLEAGEIDKVELQTNDALIEITLDGAQASNLSDDSVSDQPEGRFTYQEVKTIFLKYKEFLEMPVSLDSTLEFEL